ncbi:DUF5018-related domain-containing protein [Phocaeicola sartorii]|uniref:DUF5018-related domain-containing protein n=1 Tax=Phocaeicola sartorii TaxID=671267 RepID=UPI002432F234|nr:hypothetical protein [Phocaeicola sartorii]
MKRYTYIIVMIFLPFLLNSCLKDGLDDIEYSDECEITDIKFEHRWAVESDVEGIWTLKFKEMKVVRDIDLDNKVVTVDIMVPDTDNSFPQSERDKVNLSSLACSFFVSKAAKVTPLDGAPKLGTLGDYSSKNFRYRITSASGVSKDWQIVINSFNK